MNNIFEYVTRNKLRFESSRGQLSVEHLWDVPLRSRDGFDLNTIAKAASKAFKDITEENFVEIAKTAEHIRREAVLEVIKYVIDTKLAEEKATASRAAKKLEREQLLKILAEKQVGKLSELSEKEIQKRIAALED